MCLVGIYIISLTTLNHRRAQIEIENDARKSIKYKSDYYKKNFFIMNLLHNVDVRTIFYLVCKIRSNLIKMRVFFYFAKV